MRKILFLLCAFLSILFHSFNVQAQFAPLGAEWTYRGVYVSLGGSGRESLLKYKCTQVDTVDGKSIKTLAYTAYTQNLQYGSWGAYPYISNRDTFEKSYKLYETQDTIFVYNSLFQRYTPLYIFNVQEGDTLRIPILDTIAGGVNRTPQGDSVTVLIVDSIRNVNYAGTIAETYYVTNYYGDTTGMDWSNMNGAQDLPNPIQNWAYDVGYAPLPSGTGLAIAHGAYTRLFGGLGAGVIPNRFFIPPTGSIVEFELPIDKIFCFSNDTVSFSRNINISCDTFQHNRTVSLKEVSAAQQIRIYPNPSSGQFLIESDKPFGKNSSFSVIDILGKTVIAQTSLTQKQQYAVHTGALNAGIYFVVLEIEGQRYYKKMIISKAH
ncbi:hypothetical protein DBR32_03550 [Taibaiella sp. KBW10]|uniref:T9SS type A sorting domain-containing protein n=1 Tax=Taibaiella sp. KBW10 TaxID=2153357 RepID=UPI000F5AE84D|nr:T9SS type A sorting domain-containing protein [Taibaiella sp. KBW10]RQO31892.1 hypothetical protein DBR32_03550 [Taibaiella sp. KBW10]